MDLTFAGGRPDRAASREVTSLTALARTVRGPLRAQAAYYLLNDSWPLVHMASFEAVTGPKRDRWLVWTGLDAPAELALAGWLAAVRSG